MSQLPLTEEFKPVEHRFLRSIVEGWRFRPPPTATFSGAASSKSIVPSPVNNVERALTEVRCLQSLHKDTKISSYLQICIIRMCGFPISSLHRCMYNWCVIGVQREWYANNGGRNYGVMSGHIPHARCLRIFSGCKVRYTFRAMQ